nr:MAG TPA: hypothetical protein [Microviridae sp.]
MTIGGDSVLSAVTPYDGYCSFILIFGAPFRGTKRRGLAQSLLDRYWAR